MNNAIKFATKFNTTPKKYFKILKWRYWNQMTITEIQRLLTKNGIEINYHTLRYWIQKT